jgi:two-component system NtrC family sensor kinase
MVILVPDGALADQVRHAGRSRHVTAVVAAEGAGPSAVVESARVEHGGAPLGFLALSEADALEAIDAGADEAMALPSGEPQHVLVLLDRTAQRAAIRQARENERSSVVQSEKLAALGTVVAGVAHEINNPLAAALLATELLRSRLGPVFGAVDELHQRVAQRRGLTADELTDIVSRASAGAAAHEGKEVLGELMGFIETIAAVVRDLRIYARTDDDEAPQVVDLADLIEQVLRIVGREVTSHGHIERDYGGDLPLLLVPRSRLVQVLTNVLVNAAHAIREVERPVHRVRISVRSDAEAVALSVSDTGPGIPPESVERIFDPFFTTKRAGSGTGLGLAISRSILRRLGGDLVVESVHGVGATFIAMIPLPKHDLLRDAYKRASLPRSASPTRRASVLVVDGDPRLLRLYPRILGEHYEVLVASDGQEAIDMLSSGSVVDAVITDLQMPEVGGSQLYSWLVEQRPELARRTVFVTSAADALEQDALRRIGQTGIEKPLRRADLLEAIERVLGAASP